MSICARARFLLLIAISVCLPLVSSLLQAQATSATVMGQVRITPGNLISKPILVTLKARGITVGQSYTDEEGRFYFNGLPGNIYHVEINEEGFQPVSIAVVSDIETATMRMVNIYLVPRAPDRPAQESVAGESPYLTNEAEFAKLYPKDAVKEFKAGKKADEKSHAEEAIQHYEKAISLAPTFYMARNNLGTLYLAKSQFNDAQEQFEKVIGINPNDGSAYFNLANVNLLQNKLEDALRFVEKGLGKLPSSAFGNFLKGSIDARIGHTQDAETSLRRSLELDPKMAQSHLALVNLFLQEKRNDSAIVELKSFLKEFPDHPFSPRARDVLKRLESSGAPN